MSIPPLTLCIPTMNRWEFLKVNLPKYLANPYINEIVISDETGSDALKIQQTFNDPKIKVSVNKTRLCAFLNKEKAVSLASNEWVVLMDSDNFAPVSYFEKWAEFVKKTPMKENIVYSPSRTIPTSNHEGFDFTSFINKDLTKDNYKTYIDNKATAFIINTGNYVVHRDFYLKALDPAYKHVYERNIGVDVQLKTYFHLMNGAVFVFPPGMEYEHIIHSGSLWLNTRHELPIVGPIIDGLFTSLL